MVYYYKLDGIAKSKLDMAVGKMEGLARKELKLDDTEILTRTLRPEDVGLTGEWTFTTTATGWQTLINNQTISDNRYIAITGVFYPQSAAQGITQLELTRMGQVVRYWQIQGANFTENLAVYFDDPIIVKQNTPITVKGYVITAGTDKIQLLGATTEKVGLLVQKGL